MKDELFKELVASVKEAGQIHHGELEASRSYTTEELNIKAIRTKIGFSQSKFASLIGVNLRTLQNWEQGHRNPTGPAKILLRLVQNDPESVFRGLHMHHV